MQEIGMKLLLVDDHGLFRGGLRLLLGAMQRDLDILEADSCGDALQLMQQHHDIRLCLIDLTLRGENGMSVIALLKEINPAVVTVIVSGDESPATIYAALDAGAMGYVPKSVSPEIMVQALQLVLAGGIYLPPSLIDAKRQESDASDGSNVKFSDLTERQLQVLQCLLRGWPNKLICRDLNISDNTLKGHLAAIYRTLDVKSRTQAVIEAGRMGLKVVLEGGIQ
jgi:DNA-binding NarL/FixJ family response regulator